MPPKRRRSKTPRKRVRRRLSFSRPKRRVPRRIRITGGFPRKKALRLLYTQSIALAPSSQGTIAYHDFNANGLWDPDYTGAGSQPRGFDQWIALYDHYTVIGSRCTVEYVDGFSGGSFVPSWFGIQLLDSHSLPSAASSSPMAIAEARSGIRGHAITLPYAGGRRARFSRSCSVRKFFGKSKGSVVGASELRGTSTTNPSELAVFRVWAGIPDIAGTAVPATVNLTVRISFVVVMTEPKEMLPS